MKPPQQPDSTPHTGQLRNDSPARAMRATWRSARDKDAGTAAQAEAATGAQRGKAARADAGAPRDSGPAEAGDASMAGWQRPLASPYHPIPVAPRSRYRPWLWAVLFGLLLGALGLGLASAWISGLDISKLEHPLPEASFVLDASGQPVSELSSSKIEPVPLAQMPKHLQHAIVAVEDRRFYEHRGYDLRSIARALMRDLQSGSFDEGGSTITQQLAKNMFLSSDKTLTRKIKELGYAIKIHFAYSKDEILELYLNSIYFGEGQWGVEGAAQHYFGKPVNKVTLAEAALLAGLPKAPSRYSPVKHPEEALTRRNLVLSLMKEQQLIEAADYGQAVAEPIRLKAESGESLKGKFPAFVDYVMDEAETKYGFTEQQLLTMGLRIHTTMDLTVQQSAEAVFARQELFPASPDQKLVQAAAVVLEPASGAVRAVIGGRGEQTYRGFNRATELKRQPGSTFKPLAVYGPALEHGYTPDSMLFDGELDIGGYRPRDWDGQTRGEVSLREAVTRSWNIPAVWLLNEIGLNTGLDYLRRSGITLPAADKHLSLALGGLSEGVSPLQMAQAYAAIANQGVMQEAHAITRITTKDGKPVIEAHPQRTDVTAPVHAYTLRTLLQEAVTSGTGQAALLNGRPTAGKTGTTQLPATQEFAAVGQNGAKDAWFVGFTPELAAAVWVGYDQTDRNHYLTTSGGAVPATLFKEMMTRALQGVPVKDFPVPEEVQRAIEQARKQAEDQERERQRKSEEDIEKPDKRDYRFFENKYDRKEDKKKNRKHDDDDD
ncbi:MULTISPECIES: transglycosylase domain-containing protein [unclassified Paenibacillus]|uniref:transglycosylase domain-containing protein n=1 Tax=unclassified Paenibacillus TaxID=185978 RepID=UPI001F383A61|nr:MULTISPECIES: PBP1A family penicillin-binding protein [unclassified Paenibacillus]